MAKMTLLQMATQACGEMGFTPPSTLATTTDPTALLLLSLANREGLQCSKRPSSVGGWQELRQEYTFQTQTTGMIPACSYTKGNNVITIGTPPTQAPQVGWVLCNSGGSNATAFPYPTTITAVNGNQITLSNVPSASNTNVTMAFGQQTYALPSDYAWMIDRTEWDRTKRWQVFGPLTPQQWQVLKSGLSPTGPRRRFRIMGGAYWLDPVPYDTATLAYEYYSSAWCLTGGNSSTPASLFTTDNDTYLLPDDLMILGLIWRYRRAKGLDYAQEFETYDRALQTQIGRDIGSQIISLDVATPDIGLLTSNQIPDTGFGAGQ